MLEIKPGATRDNLDDDGHCIGRLYERLAITHHCSARCFRHPARDIEDTVASGFQRTRHMLHLVSERRKDDRRLLSGLAHEAAKGRHFGGRTDPRLAPVILVLAAHRLYVNIGVRRELADAEVEL